MIKNLDQYDLIVFDCDGVLLDVNIKKCEAFGEAVKGYPQQTIKNFVNHCKNTFGISRYVKFKEFIYEFAKEPFSNALYEKLLNNYAELCEKIYQDAEITPGALALLIDLKQSDKKLFVASGSDEEELKRVFSNRRIDMYFEEIYGSPNTKLENTSRLLKRNPNLKAVFIGDAFSDMKTAKSLGIDFIYMSKYSVQSIENEKECEGEAIKVIRTLEELR